MSDTAALQKRAVTALHCYREALARVEALERQEAAAQQTLAEWRNGVEATIVDGYASSERSHLIQAGRAAIAALQEVRFALNEAKAALDLSHRTLAAMDDELGYTRTADLAKLDGTDAAKSREE